MRKQLISFAQVIKFCKISSSRGGLTPKAPLAYALGCSCIHSQPKSLDFNEVAFVRRSSRVRHSPVERHWNNASIFRRGELCMQCPNHFLKQIARCLRPILSATPLLNRAAKPVWYLQGLLLRLAVLSGG